MLYNISDQLLSTDKMALPLISSVNCRTKVMIFNFIIQWKLWTDVADSNLRPLSKSEKRKLVGIDNISTIQMI